MTPRDAQRIVTGQALVDRAIDEVRDAHASVVHARVVQALLIEDRQLAEATDTRIHHGRNARVSVVPMSIRGATSTGRIVQSADATDPRNYVVLRATGHGATITVDILVL